MAIIGGIIGLLGRFAGQILNTTLGWATLLLFGKVPQSRQTLLLVIVFGSLVWVALVIGVITPPVGTLLIAAIPLSDAVDPTWPRMGMLAGAIALPFVIGVASALVSPDTTRRGPVAIVTAGLRGYPFALVLTLMLVLLAAVGVGRWIRSLTKHWEGAHVPLIVKPGGYEAVLRDVEETLDLAGLDTAPRDAGVLLTAPPKLLDKIAGRGLGDLVPDRMVILAGENLEVLVYPSDLAISGTRDRVARARAALASRVTDAPAYLTTTAESQKVEDVLDGIRAEAKRRGPAATLAALWELDEQLASLAVPYDEWQILYRQRLQVERDARAAMDHDATADFVDESRRGAERPRAQRQGGISLPSPAGLAIGVAGTALVAVDVALQLADRRGNGKGHA